MVEQQRRERRADDVRHRDRQKLTEDRTQSGKPVKATVIAGIGAVLVAVIVTRQAQQRIGQIQLLG